MAPSISGEEPLIGLVDKCQGTHHLGYTCRPNLMTLTKRDIIYQGHLNMLVELLDISKIPSFEKEVAKKMPLWREHQFSYFYSEGIRRLRQI